MGASRTERNPVEWLPLDDLVRGAQAGEPAAVSELALRFRPMAVAVAARLVDATLAEDVAHDALLEVFGTLGDIRQPFALRFATIVGSTVEDAEVALARARPASSTRSPSTET